MNIDDREEIMSRPGNSARGWNDPPMFFYNPENVNSNTPRKKLTQRVGLPQQTSPRPPGGIVEPPRGYVLPASAASQEAPKAPPPKTYVSSFSSTAPSQESSQQNANLSSCTCDEVLKRLKVIVAECEEHMKKRTKDDILKKLSILESAWNTDKLSLSVRLKMNQVSNDLKERRYDDAHHIHLALMVDYISEVGQWMVGIKRLIQEARTLRPYIPEDTPSSIPTSTTEGGEATMDPSAHPCQSPDPQVGEASESTPSKEGDSVTHAEEIHLEDSLGDLKLENNSHIDVTN